MSKAGGQEWTMIYHAGNPPSFSLHRGDMGTVREADFLGTEPVIKAGSRTVLDLLVGEGLNRQKIIQGQLLEKFAAQIERLRRDEAFHPQITCRFDPDRYR